jgi:hypothetical protein
MSGTALDHRLVRDDLAALDAAMRGLPAAQARELKKQITAHLDDALPPDADDQDVAATLRKLGSPADLAAGARRLVAGPQQAGPAIPAASSTSTPHALRVLVASVRPRTWIAAGLLVIIGTATSTQDTTPIRSGQRQGYVISIYNGTSVTQTIVGDASSQYGWNSPGSGTEQLAVSRSYTDVANGIVGQGAASHLSFTLPVSIPPFQSRLVRALWTSNLCLAKGESNGIDTISLRVRVGWFTRTERIPQQGWYLVGPSQGRCV